MRPMPTELPARFHPGVIANFMVKVHNQGRTVLAKAHDLSMAGVSVLGDFSQVDTRITVAIPLPNDREIVCLATVRRCSEGELGLEFDQLDWDDMFALARYLHPRL
jgi:PilZ domain